jgi:hypothetical protein
MPRKSPVIEMEAEAPASNGHTPGWHPGNTTRRATADAERYPALAPAEGAEPFWADIRDDLTIDQVDRIPFTLETPLSEMWVAMAPYVVAWNAVGHDPTTNTWEPVPPPAVAGPDAFKVIPKYAAVTLFLAQALKFHADLNLPKGRKRSGGMDAG